jgi:adenine-specific DNA-methyltransferase
MSTAHPTLNREARRRHGIFYTPDALARSIAEWAVTKPGATVLDPSFGGCAFLRAAVSRLRNLHAPRAPRQVFGADRDPAARTWLSSILEQGAEEKQFFFEDFLSLRPAQFRALFTAVLGNPPYVKHHSIPQRLHRSAVHALADNDWQLSAMASYWAYFVLHSIDFVAPGGRLALILPGSLVHADYASVVRLALTNAFGKVTAIFLQERIFPEAEEESVLLLAEQRGQTRIEVRVGLASCSSVRLDEQGLDRCTQPLAYPDREDSWLRAVLDSKILSAYDQAATQCYRLREKATIRIGVVTGANHFFIGKPSVFRELAIPRRHTTPILGRASLLRGLVFGKTSLKNAQNSDSACLLIRPPSRSPADAAVKAYLRKGIKEGIHERHKCSIREPWYRVKLGAAPDAFLTYMSGKAPRLVINDAQIPSTNAIHGVTWLNTVSERESRSIAVGFLSTLTQLSAELEGRSYGGGVLKLEPSEAGALVIPLVDSNRLATLFRSANQLCRDGDEDVATQMVDETLQADLFTRTELSRLRLGLQMLRRRRLARTVLQLNDPEDPKHTSCQN